jgi:hypothetical protein
MTAAICTGHKVNKVKGSIKNSFFTILGNLFNKYDVCLKRFIFSNV